MSTSLESWKGAEARHAQEFFGLAPHGEGQACPTGLSWEAS